MTAHLSRGDPPVADAPVIHSRSVLRQMDHFIMALKTDAAQDRPTFFLSLYWIEYAADAEPGHVAYLWATGIDGVEPIEAVITDSLAIPKNAKSRRAEPPPASAAARLHQPTTCDLSALGRSAVRDFAPYGISRSSVFRVFEVLRRSRFVRRYGRYMPACY